MLWTIDDSSQQISMLFWSSIMGFYRKATKINVEKIPKLIANKKSPQISSGMWIIKRKWFLGHVVQMIEVGEIQMKYLNGIVICSGFGVLLINLVPSQSRDISAVSLIDVHILHQRWLKMKNCYSCYDTCMSVKAKWQTKKVICQYLVIIWQGQCSWYPCNAPQ